MDKLDIQKLLDYIDLQIGRVDDEIYDATRNCDYGRGHALRELEAWRNDLYSEYDFYNRVLELIIKSEVIK